MWKMRNYLPPAVLLTAMVVSSGCAGLGFNDYEKYAQAMADHSQAEADRISAQADAIWATVSSSGGTDTERLLLAVIGTMQIERLQPVPLRLDAPVTGFAVLNNLVDKGPVLAGFGAAGWIATSAFDRIGGTEISGETITMDRSFNPVEAHATGTQNAVSVPYMPVTETITNGAAQ